MDIRDYLFLPTTTSTAAIIKDKIQTNIKKFEPRVTIVSLSVIPDIDNNQYEINIVIGVPFLQVDDYILNFYLNSEGYLVF